MAQSLAVKYRPQTLNDLIGQNITTRILNKVIEKQQYKNAYLWAGPSGCGKTSCARAFANAINGSLNGLIELDAASNGNIDQIRALVDSANQRSLSSIYKIILIDECHAISTAGWQVFLKCLEECPEYTIFMFCTTEPNKIPVTIQNRMQRFNIAKIGAQEIKNRLFYVCQQEGFTNYEDACELISKLCDGCMREALTMLDQCADLSNDLSLENTKAVLGEAPFERMLKLTNCLIGHNEQFTLVAIETLAQEGKDLKHFVNEYLSFTLELTKYILFQNIGATNIPAYLENSADPMISVKATTNFENSLGWFNNLANKLLEVKNAIKYDTSVKAVVEAYFLQICRGN
jgi:DNA polymerase-3 subunit gamma/tau